MRSLCVLLAVTFLTLATGMPADARSALIQTSAALADQSEESVKRAATEAIETAARGAAAMGLQWIQLRGARVVNDTLVVLILATDTEAQDAGATNPGMPGASSMDGEL